MTEFNGLALKQRREEKGLSLLDASQEIHVPKEYIQAFERGALDELPAPAYAAGFLRTYCELLELDAPSFVDQYRVCLHTAGEDCGYSLSPLSRLRGDAADRPVWFNDLVTWATICGIIMLSWVAYSVLTRPFADKVGAHEKSIQKPEKNLPFDLDF